MAGNIVFLPEAEANPVGAVAVAVAVGVVIGLIMLAIEEAADITNPNGPEVNVFINAVSSSHEIAVQVEVTNGVVTVTVGSSQADVDLGACVFCGECDNYFPGISNLDSEIVYGGVGVCPVMCISGGE